jgi:hypothetical protein
MKQYKITSKNISQIEENDCYLNPDDPIHKLIISHTMDGLGSAAKLAEYNKYKYKQLPAVDTRQQTMREQNIQPGTTAWFTLWFGKK